MSPQALHAAARRLISDRIDKYSQEYGELEEGGGAREPPDAQINWHYSVRAKELFPRYNVLGAMLVAVERFDPDSLPQPTELREQLTTIAETASSAFTESKDPVETATIADERENMRELLSNLEPTPLDEELPYHRVLSDAESTEIWDRIRARWDLGTGNYWYPLNGQPAPADSAAFEVPWDGQDELATGLRKAVARLGHDRVFEMTSEGIDAGGGPGDVEYETSLGAWWPLYGGLESYSTDRDTSWLLYASHESTLTVCGMKLLDATQTALRSLTVIPDPHPRITS